MSRADAGDEELLEGGHRRARQFADLVGANRYLAPPQDGEVFFFGDPLDGRLDLSAESVIERQESDADRVPARFRELEIGDRLKELVRDLGNDPRTIAGAGIRPDRPAMLEIAQCVKRLDDDVVTGHPTKSRHHRETAGVALESGIVEPGCFGD